MSVRNSTWYARSGQWQRLGQTPITPGVTGKPLVGAATQSDTEASFTSFEGEVGSLLMRRCYTASEIFPATFADSTAGIDIGVRESMWSFKPIPATFASGANDAWFDGFLDSIPSGQRVIIILWHEPEDNIRDGEFTLADWKAANNRMGQMVHAKNRPELRTAINLLGPWTFDPNSPYHTIDYWDSGFDQNIDYVGYDPYNQSLGFEDMGGDTNFELAMTWATSTHNKQVIIPEFGCIDDPNDATKKAQWITNFYNYCKSVGIYSLCYFNINLTITNVKLITPEAVAAYSAANADSKVA